MNMIFELIGLLLVVGCAFFTTFFLAAVAGTMVVILGWGISIVTPKVVTCTKEGANKQVISSQADSLIKISRIWADFFPANTSNQPI
ncbi:hypothetical protein [Enterobacter hormaechei]|uniref:hypothetical protein n=1 Tax=Enterobacter hormaechei TaxID=158836 RepID=UPI0012B9B61A|nr:hypothetical protein [Enterobacter hormaechei]QLP00899.1 hypothetical protein HV047_25155 [Enterobacter hormaechei]